jgi:iron(III) transport system substrate-binding protein
VLHPKWRDRIIIRDPIASGTMRAIFGAMIARELARTGSTRAGYDWLLRLDRNTKEYTLNPTILYQNGWCRRAERQCSWRDSRS